MPLYKTLERTDAWYAIKAHPASEPVAYVYTTWKDDELGYSYLILDADRNDILRAPPSMEAALVWIEQNLLRKGES